MAGLSGRSGLDGSFSKEAGDPLGPDDVALGFVQLDGLLEGRSGLLRAIRETQDLAEISQRLRSQFEDVGGSRRL